MEVASLASPKDQPPLCICLLSSHASAPALVPAGLIPAYTAAAFAKRMARLALSAPPAGAMLAIAFIHNLIRRHPATMVLLDRQPARAAADEADDDAESMAGRDVFDPAEQDPGKCRAVESSLWEVSCLRNHYCAQVAALCSILDKELSDRTKTTEVDVDPLLTSSYSSLFKHEVERRVKQVPLAFYKHPPSKLFGPESEKDFAGWAW